MTATTPVLYEDAEPNGLAAMIGGVVQGNLDAHPERSSFVRQGGVATFAISLPDVGVSVAIRFSPGGVQIKGGLVERPDVRIECDSETLLSLSNAPLRFGLPDVTKPSGREVVRKVLSRKLKLRGAILHAGKLARLNKLLSVA